MVGLLSRAWWTLCQRSSISRMLDDDDSEDYDESSSKLSHDLLFLIFERLSAKDLVAASLSCKAWKFVGCQESLWERLLAQEVHPNWKLVLFTEGYLRPGFALRSPSLPLPFQMIYGQRAVVPRSVILDAGAGYCKCGWSSQDQPSKKLPTFLEFGNIESPIYPRLKELFSTLFQCLPAKPSAQPVVLTAPINNADDTEAAMAARKQLREITFSILFEMGVPAICAVDQAVLALFSARRISGIVVNIGYYVTSIVPVLNGKVMRTIGVEVVGQGAMQITVELGRLMQQNGHSFASMFTVRSLKEKLCYVAQDFEEELCKNTRVTCTVANEWAHTLEDEQFRAPEILFQPRLGQLRTMSLQQAVALCMEHCAAVPVKHESDIDWYKTIVLAGGTACLPGLAGRLKKEVSSALSSRGLAAGLNIIPPEHGPDSAWFGAKLLSNLSTFPASWCVTKKQYRRYGTSAVHATSLDENGFIAFGDMAKSQSWREKAKVQWYRSSGHDFR